MKEESEDDKKVLSRLGRLFYPYIPTDTETEEDVITDKTASILVSILSVIIVVGIILWFIFK